MLEQKNKRKKTCELTSIIQTNVLKQIKLQLQPCK